MHIKIEFKRRSIKILFTNQKYSANKEERNSKGDNSSCLINDITSKYTNRKPTTSR